MNNLRLLSVTHMVMRMRAKQCALHSFPKILNSLIEKHPTKEDIDYDFALISKFKSHPVFLNYLPNHTELEFSHNEIDALLKRCNAG